MRFCSLTTQKQQRTKKTLKTLSSLNFSLFSANKEAITMQLWLRNMERRFRREFRTSDNKIRRNFLDDIAENGYPSRRRSCLRRLPLNLAPLERWSQIWTIKFQPRRSNICSKSLAIPSRLASLRMAFDDDSEGNFNSQANIELEDASNYSFIQ